MIPFSMDPLSHMYSVVTDHLKDNLVIEDEAIWQLLHQSLLKCRENEPAVLSCLLHSSRIQLNIHV